MPFVLSLPGEGYETPNYSGNNYQLYNIMSIHLLSFSERATYFHRYYCSRCFLGEGGLSVGGVFFYYVHDLRKGKRRGLGLWGL